MKARRTALLVVAAALAVPPASGQSEGLSGYVQTVPVLLTRESSRAGEATLFNRVRVRRALTLGPLSLDVAHEVSAVLAGAADPALGAVAGSGARDGQWLNLQWVLSDRGRMRAQHRFDRLQAAWSPVEDVDVSIGRQAVSWGTTLLLTPADPFLPFRPEDPFREFRGGIDAARLRFYPGPLSEIDLVIRPSRLGGDEELTALARGLTSWGSWEVSGWGGVLYGDGAAAVAAAGGVGEWAARSEAVVREVEGRAVWRGAVGVDRTLELGGREARFVLELQRDGLGAAGPDELETLPESRAFRRGELQVRGREELAAAGGVSDPSPLERLRHRALESEPRRRVAGSRLLLLPRGRSDREGRRLSRHAQAHPGRLPGPRGERAADGHGIPCVDMVFLAGSCGRAARFPPVHVRPVWKGRNPGRPAKRGLTPATPCANIAHRFEPRAAR